jgi:TrmH family RNA methyltransferase
MYLDSPQNPKIRKWSELKTKKGRLAEAAFLVEGMRLVEEVLASELKVTEILWDSGGDEITDSIREHIDDLGIPFYELSPRAFQRVSDTVNSQGLIAIVELPDEAGTPWRLPHIALLLDGVQDPGNVGTLIRSSDAFAVGEVCCGSGTVDAYAPKVVRASMGGLFRVPVVNGQSALYIQQWIEKWPSGQVVSTGSQSGRVSWEMDFTRPTMLVIGSEAFGVSAETAALASTEIRIPMSGEAESLNAATAGAILLYEVFRQRSSMAKV